MSRVEDRFNSEESSDTETACKCTWFRFTLLMTTVANLLVARLCELNHWPGSDLLDVTLRQLPVSLCYQKPVVMVMKSLVCQKPVPNSYLVTTLENMEISGNLLILQNSGKTQGIWNKFRKFLYIRCYFLWRSLKHTTSWHVGLRSYSCTYVTMLLKDILCNSARKVLKWLLRLFVALCFHFIIVWKRLFRGSGKPGKIRNVILPNF